MTSVVVLAILVKIKIPKGPIVTVYRINGSSNFVEKLLAFTQSSHKAVIVKYENI
jgi:hypothetical protein